jgi:hypothetical protein
MRIPAVLFAVLAGASTAAGQSGLGLGVSINQSLYFPGERLSLSVSATNTGGTGVADFYTGVILPDGITVATIGPGGTARIGTLLQPAALLPVATGVSLAGPFSASVDPLFNYVWNGSEPVGAYTVFLAAVRSGGFSDGRVDGGDILAVELGGLHVARPTAPTLEPEGSVTVSIPETGGTIAVNSRNGARFSLDLPSGAVPESTAITAIPVARFDGLPIQRFLGGVSFQPDGLRFGDAGTLTMTFPSGKVPHGLVGFTARSDGTGFEQVPVSIDGATVSLKLPHFSVGGFGQNVCGPAVTTAVGRDACREMAEDIALAVSMIDDLGSFTPDVRRNLARQIIRELLQWLKSVILPALTDAANPALTDPVTDHTLLVALKEFSSILAILQMTAILDVEATLAPETNEARSKIRPAISGRQQVANARCLRDRPEFQPHIRRIFDLASLAEFWDVDLGPTRGLTCIQLSLEVSFPRVLTNGSAGLLATAILTFSDGLQADTSDRVAITLDMIRGSADEPTQSSGPGSTFLNTRLFMNEDSVLIAEITARAPSLGLFQETILRRGHTISVGTSRVFGRKELRAHTRRAEFGANDDSSVRLFAQELRDGTDVANVEESLVEVAFPDGSMIRGNGHYAMQVTGDASALVRLSTDAEMHLSGDFDCEISLTTSATAARGLQLRLLQDRTVVFESGTTTSARRLCPSGTYTVELDTEMQISRSRTGESASWNRDYSFEFRVTPRETSTADLRPPQRE